MSHVASYPRYHAFKALRRTGAVDHDDGDFRLDNQFNALSSVSTGGITSSGNFVSKWESTTQELESAAPNLAPLRRVYEGAADWLRSNRIVEHSAIFDMAIPIPYEFQMEAAYPTNSAAFSVRHEMPRWTAEVARLIAGCRNTLRWQHTSRLVQRLQELLRDVTEEEDTDSSISATSLENFFEFVRENPNLTFPKLAVTPDGYIYARWKADRQKLFSAQFLPDGNVRFVVFKPNPRHKNVTARFSGLTTSDSIIDEIRNHNISNWVLEAPHER